MGKILVVEDDESTLEFIEPELKHEGFDVVTATDGRMALEVFEKENPDLITLDVMLPELNGIEVLRRIRKTSSVPVILVTARGETLDKVNGLNAGADDYIAKPFMIEELLARINAVLRRTQDSASKESELKNGEIILNTSSMITTVAGNQIDLSKTEYLLLKLYLEKQGEVLSRNDIIDQVWGKDHYIDISVVDVYTSYLRTKIGKFSKKDYFKNVRGVGFIMNVIG